RALQTIGFSVEQHLARVCLNSNPAKDPPHPATHTSLQVETEGRLWLVDVGFGGYMPNVPIKWQPLVPQQTDFGIFRLSETRDGFLLEFQYREQWRPLYEILDFNWQA